MVSINIHQALFGYNKGHKLLHSSIDISKENLKLLNRLTDLSGTIKNKDNFNPYYSGFKLNDGIYYCFAKTWLDRESYRPGAVNTHCLFIKHSDLGKITNFKIIKKYFRTPNSNSNYAYNQTIEMELKKFELTKLQFNIETKEKIFSFVNLFFKDLVKPTIWVYSDIFTLFDDPVDFVFNLYNVLWPNLISTLSFCTYSPQPRYFDEFSQMDIIFTDARPNQYEEFKFQNYVNKYDKKNALNTNSDRWASNFVNDVFMNQLASKIPYHSEIKSILSSSKETIQRLYLLEKLIENYSQKNFLSILDIICIIIEKTDNNIVFQEFLIKTLNLDLKLKYYFISSKMSSDNKFDFTNFIFLIGERLSNSCLNAIDKINKNYTELFNSKFSENHNNFLDKYLERYKPITNEIGYIKKCLIASIITSNKNRSKLFDLNTNNFRIVEKTILNISNPFFKIKFRDKLIEYLIKDSTSKLLQHLISETSSKDFYFVINKIQLKSNNFEDISFINIYMKLIENNKKITLKWILEQNKWSFGLGIIGSYLFKSIDDIINSDIVFSNKSQIILGFMYKSLEENKLDGNNDIKSKNLELYLIDILDKITRVDKKSYKTIDFWLNYSEPSNLVVDQIIRNYSSIEYIFGNTFVKIFSNGLIKHILRNNLNYDFIKTISIKTSQKTNLIFDSLDNIILNLGNDSIKYPNYQIFWDLLRNYDFNDINCEQVVNSFLLILNFFNLEELNLKSNFIIENIKKLKSKCSGYFFRKLCLDMFDTINNQFYRIPSFFEILPLIYPEIYINEKNKTKVGFVYYIIEFFRGKYYHIDWLRWDLVKLFNKANWPFLYLLISQPNEQEIDIMFEKIKYHDYAFNTNHWNKLKEQFVVFEMKVVEYGEKIKFIQKKFNNFNNR